MNDTYTTPDFLINKTKELNDSFYLILAEIIKTYPNSKTYPNDENNNALHTTNMNSMKKLQSDYFLHKNLVAKEGEHMSRGTVLLDIEIDRLEESNKQIQKRLDDLMNSDNSAEGILDDTKITRNQMFIGNILLFATMVGGGYLYYKKTVV